MFLRNALPLTPCLALFLLACNDNTAHQQAPPQAASPQVAAQKDQPTDQSTTTATEPAKPAATFRSAHHHHVVYAKHHAIVRPAHAAAMAENASAAEPAAAAPTPPAVMVPTGTVLSVKLTQELASKTNNAGDPFTATVSDAVMVDGKPLIPEGTTVSGNITEAAPMGTLHKGVLQLTLHSINLNGQEQAIQTSTASEVEKDKTANAGGMAESAAAVTAPAAGMAESAGAMTAPTASAAGMAGAAKSGALGGGGLKSEAEAKAGTVVAALTGNRDLIFPAQASMKFTLEQALEIKP